MSDNVFFISDTHDGLSPGNSFLPYEELWSLVKSLGL